MTEDERALYDIYASWSGKLHFWVLQRLERTLSCEFEPDTWTFKMWPGAPDVSVSMSGVPHVRAPKDAYRVALLSPAQHPTGAQLDELFKQLCLAAARVLNIDLNRTQLTYDKPTNAKRELTRVPSVRRLRRGKETGSADS
jgi:hypothetical protein